MELYNCINFMLNCAQQSVSQIFRDHLADFDITPVQYAILKALWGQDGMSPKDLSEAVVVDRPAMTGILDRLEAKNLIYRSPDMHDRRAINVFLTPKAFEMQDVINKAVEDAHEYSLRNFSEEEIIAFSAFLRKIVNN